MVGVIDCEVLHSWASPLDVFRYLSPGWREYVAEHLMPPWHDHAWGFTPLPRGTVGVHPMGYDLAYRNPMGDFAAGSGLSGAVVGGDHEMLRHQHRDPGHVECSLLCHGTGMLVPRWRCLASRSSSRCPSKTRRALSA